MRSNNDDQQQSLAQLGQSERPFAMAGARVIATIHLLRCARKLFHRIVALANSGGKFLAQTFRRLAKLVPALSRGLRECRIRKMRTIANAGAIFFNFNLALEIRGHLIEFANNALEVFYLSRFLFDFVPL
jgi:hypothetical protein